MSAPKLILLTGPAAGDVARVLHPDSCERCDVSMDPCSLCPVRLGFEVRDYRAAPIRIALNYPEHRVVEHGIRSLPGGEEWLVGLVLPEPLTLSDSILGLTRQEQLMPARLAILAPEPPRLLVERVMAWGGDRWHCYQDMGQCVIDPWGHPVCNAATWPEAVRAALEEA